ncbi:anthranilate synthase component I family protein [Microbacterium thalassium]|uniref:Anthranilate synthase component 1 n=1 Tax=Microbacterium thalassium TaxID=362649 RepID=A0A7X0FQU2_9MICO|nr:anthranilate synthase component I family protein [Microbacterium thalassium]MBB6392019.1 anthranilate synthase component 1 [Microbacterium thalassium]
MADATVADATVAMRLPAWVDPALVHARLFARRPHVFWLDSGPDAAHGWTYVGAGSEEPDADAVRSVALGGAASGDRDAGPFSGGWVGWIPYEDGAAAAGAAVAEGGRIPAARWIRAEEWLAFDHARRAVWAVARAERVDDLAAAAAACTDGTEQEPAEPVAERTASARHAPGEYAELIESCRAAIREGDAYQLCLTTRFAVPGAHDPATVFARLRAAHPAPYGALIRSGDAALASASPESFLRVRDGIVSTSPIKGTRRRGATDAEDARLVADLLSDPKELAENVMIVDLMRNDLSRVCRPGSVAVERLFEVQTHPAVHQLVSVVTGALEPAITFGELMDAAFPAGSMTGAPKLAAMNLLNGFEGAARGVYSGCFGWVGDDGALDLGMVIRSIVFDAGGASVGAGGGITWRSVARAEVAEVALKARGPLAALGARLPDDWRQVGVG